MCTLRLSLASYRLPRTLGADGAFSRLIIAVLGITAGAGFATFELRLFLHEVVVGTMAAWPLIVITLYVDDATLEAAHQSRRVAQAVLAGATDHMVRHLEGSLQLEVSLKKSVTVASSPLMASNVATAARSRALRPVRTAKLLGVSVAGGRRRSVKHLAVRVNTFRKRIPRIHRLRKARINTTAVVRAAGTPMLTYGTDVIGMADSHLRSCRCAVAKAVAPEAGGKQHELILYTADGASGTLDPAFDAHALPLYMWAMAHWHQWLPLQCLHESIVNAQSKVLDGSTPVWRRVTGPAAAVVASAARIGWSFISGRVACCDDQSTIDFLLDPPVVVVQAVRRSVRRWRLKEISKQFPPLVPQAPDVNVAAPHGHLDVTFILVF